MKTLTATKIAEIANTVPAVSAFVEGNSVVCTYRAKRGDAILIDADTLEVDALKSEAAGAAESIRTALAAAVAEVVEVVEVVEVAETTIANLLPDADLSSLKGLETKPCIVIERKESKQEGAFFLLVSIDGTKHVVVVESDDAGQFAYINNDYLKHIFNL